MTAETPEYQVPQGAPHVLLQALPSRSSLTRARTEAASPGQPPRSTSGGVSLPPGLSPATFFFRLGLRNPGPVQTEISHDPLPPTVRNWELQGYAPKASETAK